MTAFVRIKPGLGRLPAGVPYAGTILNIEILSVIVIRNIVVTIAGQAEKLGILIEGVTSAGIGNQGKKVLAAQIINPGKGRFGCGDHIFAALIIKKTIFHTNTFLSAWRTLFS